MQDKIDMKDVTTVLIGAAVVALEELVKHPIGGVASVIGLLFVFERWRTQRILYKLTKKQLEDGKDNSITEERKRES